MKKTLALFFTSLSSLYISFAADVATNGQIVLQKVVSEVLSPLYQFVAGIALIYFFYGVFRFVLDMNDPEKKNTGKRHLLWGLVGLFIILSVGGLLKLFNSVLGGMFVY